LVERDQWALGDALLEECGAPGDDGVNNGSGAKLQAAQVELAADGFEYEVDTLRKYRDLSATFPAGTRIPAVSHRVHIECRTPGMLKAVLTAWEKEKPGQKLALHACARLITEIRRQVTVKWEREWAVKHEAAQKKRAAADVWVTAAKAKQMAAAPGPDRESAAVEVRKAVRAAERAAAEVEKAAAPPKGDPLVPPPAEKIPAMLFSMEMLSKAMKAVTLANEALGLAEEKLGSYRQGDDYHGLNEDDFGAVVEQALKAADRWRSVAALFQKASGKKGIHLSAVGGE
jgi:hypothetical protein